MTNGCFSPLTGIIWILTLPVWLISRGCNTILVHFRSFNTIFNPVFHICKVMNPLRASQSGWQPGLIPAFSSKFTAICGCILYLPRTSGNIEPGFFGDRCFVHFQRRCPHFRAERRLAPARGAGSRRPVPEAIAPKPNPHPRASMGLFRTVLLLLAGG